MAGKEVSGRKEGRGGTEVVKTSPDGFYRSRPQQFRPTSAQASMFGRWLELCRRMENDLVEVVRRMLSAGFRFVYSVFNLKNLVTAIKKRSKLRGGPDYYSVPAQILTGVAENVYRSVKAFFATGKEHGYNVSRIAFNGKGSYKTMAVPAQLLEFGEDLGSVRLPKAGWVRVHRSSYLPGVPVNIVIKRKDGHWNCIFVCRCRSDGEGWTETADGKVPVVGVDWGMKDLAVTSDGRRYPHLRFDRMFEKEIMRERRRMSSCIGKDGRIADRARFSKAKRRLGHMMDRVSGLKKTYYDRVAADIVGGAGVVVVERIRPRQIQRKNRNRGFRRSLADSAPGTLFERIRMKAERAAATMVKVDPANTSRECSRCGNMVDKALKDRTHRCDVCGLVCDRDENAACVIGSRPMDLGSKLPGTGSWELVRKCNPHELH